MAAGTPVVVSDSGGLAEIVKHEEDGLHAITGSASSLADQILRVLKNDFLAKKLRDNALQKIKTMYDWRVIARKTAEVYDAVVRENSARWRDAGRISWSVTGKVQLPQQGGDQLKAVVMAGGEGTRLRPLTCNIPKPMMPVFDKPVMEYSLELLKKYGIKDIAVTLQYLPEAVEGYFRDGRDRGLNIRYFVEDTPLGTAGSVKNAEEFLDETFIVISGDALTDFHSMRPLNFTAPGEPWRLWC